MQILFFLATLFAPRFVILGLWIFSEWFTGVFTHALIPILGFIFTPYTLLWYTVVIHWFDGVWSLWQIIFLVVALLLDLSQLRSRRG